MSPSPPPSSTSPDLPLKPIPGSHGIPFISPIIDRLNYFYYQGRDQFFTTLIAKHNSTVVRTNMPPGPFIAGDPKVIALLDSASFPVLFDTSKVEKRNVLLGTYGPFVSFTGGHRVLAFLDSSEPKHAALKSLVMSFLCSKHEAFVPLCRASLFRMFVDFDGEFVRSGKDPSETELETRGATLADKWLAPQLAPLSTLGLFPKWLSFIEDFFLHTLPFPFFLVKSDYHKLYAAFYTHATSFLDRAVESLPIQRDEACHNLVFIASFNAYGAMKALFPSIIKWVATTGKKLQLDLAREIRTVVMEEGGEMSPGALDKMTLTKSVVYEVLRIEPPIRFQYGKAKGDMVVSSHDAAFKVKKGEMLFGYQPFVTRDRKVFDRADEFVGDRFVGKEGEKLLKYVYWSNGRETEDPTAGNKQCPGKDLVVLMSSIPSQIKALLSLHYQNFLSNPPPASEISKLLMGKKSYLAMKTDRGSSLGSELISSDVRELAVAAKNLVIHLGIVAGFGTSFLEWLAAIAAIYLLILDRTNWKTNILTGLLIPYIFFTLPTFLFGFLRGEFGKWVAIIAVVLRLFFPHRFPDWLEMPGALILLIVVAPSLFASTLRNNLVGVAICLLIACYLLQEHIRASGGFRNSFTKANGISNTIGIILLFVYPAWALIVDLV
ncbi:Allene oxide synthase 1, chloroplastic [Linum perenne]